MAEDRNWPGSIDGACPECKVIADGWDMEYHVAKIHHHGAETVVLPVVPEILVALRCPSCKTRFKTADYK